MAIDGRNVFERLTPNRGDPFAADEIVIMRPDRDLIGDVRQNFIDHVCLPDFFKSPPDVGTPASSIGAPRRRPAFPEFSSPLDLVPYRCLGRIFVTKVL